MDDSVHLDYHSAEARKTLFTEINLIVMATESPANPSTTYRLTEHKWFIIIICIPWHSINSLMRMGLRVTPLPALLLLLPWTTPIGTKAAKMESRMA